MADKGIRCKLCGERHPGGVHISPNAVKAVATPVVTLPLVVASSPAEYVTDPVSNVTVAVGVTAGNVTGSRAKQSRWEASNPDKVKAQAKERMRRYRAKPKQAASP